MLKVNTGKSKGITLVALVITIIILLLLAGITISQLTGSKLFEKAQLAKEKYENEQANEEAKLEDYKNIIEEHVNGSNRESTYFSLDYKNTIDLTNTLVNVGASYICNKNGIVYVSVAHVDNSTNGLYTLRLKNSYTNFRCFFYQNTLWFRHTGNFLVTEGDEIIVETNENNMKIEDIRYIPFK